MDGKKRFSFALNFKILCVYQLIILSPSEQFTPRAHCDTILILGFFIPTAKKLNYPQPQFSTEFYPVKFNFLATEIISCHSISRSSCKEELWPSGHCVRLKIQQPMFEASSDLQLDLLSGRPKFKILTTFVHSQLRLLHASCFFSNPVMLNFKLFVWDPL